MKKKLSFLLLKKHGLDTYIGNNFNRLKIYHLFYPISLLVIIAVYLLAKNSFSIDAYIWSQQSLFISINSTLSKFASFQFNITQLGDLLILLPFLSIFFISASKLWKSTLSALLVSLIFSASLKKLFSVPRPAAIFSDEHIVVIGKRLCGSTSTPSGHSISAITVFTLVFLAFMPKKTKHKLIWSFFMLSIGLLVVFSRVGVGAHYPLDVIIGGAIGYISALIGIFINKKYDLWKWIFNKRYYPIFISLFSIWAIVLITKMAKTDLTIYYLSLACLIVTIFTITYNYVKKQY